MLFPLSLKLLLTLPRELTSRVIDVLRLLAKENYLASTTLRQYPTDWVKRKCKGCSFFIYPDDYSNSGKQAKFVEN